MITLSAALPVELRRFRKELNASFICRFGKKQILYRSGDIDLLLTGVGQQKTERVLRAYLETSAPELLLNIGMAGILNYKLISPDVVQLETIAHETSPDSFLSCRPVSDYPTVAGLTVTRPVIDRAFADRLHKNFSADVVDMEAYYTATICAGRGLPFASLKVCTDYADEKAVKDLEKIAVIACDKLFEAVISIIKKGEIK